MAARKNLIGIRLNMAGSSKQGITASESYISEADNNTGTAALCHALIITLQLVLQRLDISLFYDPATLPAPCSLDDPLFSRLKNEFPKVTFIACSKGRHMEALWKKLAALQSTKTNEIVPSHLSAIRQSVLAFSESVSAVTDVPPPLPGSNTDRGALLLAARWFFDRAIKLESITRIALIGSICTDKQNPKDIDILLTIKPEADIAPISRLKRQMSGRIQRGLLGADIFLMEEEEGYIGRLCHFREPHLRVGCTQDGLRCDFDKPFLCDTSNSFRLKKEVTTSPSIVLYPNLLTARKIPLDVQAVFNMMRENS